MQRDNRRLEEAKAIPMLEVAERLSLKLARISATEREGPCPDCGGRDRFAINTAKNIFGCRKCGAGGDQVALVQLAHGCDFKAALAFLVGEAEAEIDPAEAERRRRKRAAEAKRQAEIEASMRAKAIREAREIWTRAEGGDLAPARAYLAGRGIAFEHWPRTLRCIPELPYVRKIAGEWREWHRGPAMIAAVWAPDGSLRAVHQTWLDPATPGAKAEILGPDGKPLPAKLVRGSKKGGAIRLSRQPSEGGCLVVGEGIETTASAMVAGAVPGAAYWAGVDLGNMAGRQLKLEDRRHSGLPDLSDPDAFLPPPWIGRLVYLQDGDSDPTATRAKLESGLRRAQHHLGRHLRADIVAAPRGKDFNDLLRGGDDDDHTPQG